MSFKEIRIPKYVVRYPTLTDLKLRPIYIG